MAILSAGIAGAATGILGTITTTVFGYFNDKQKNKQELEVLKETNKHESEMVDARIREMEAESRAQIQKITLEGDIARDIAAQESFNISQQFGNQRAIDNSSIKLLFEYKWTRWLGALLVFLLAIGDVLRVYIRPCITISLMIITSGIVVYHLQILDDNVELIDKDTIFMVIDSVIYLTVSVILWWFGMRTTEKTPRKGRNN